MRKRLMILCSGQGGQTGAMFDLARSDPRGRALLERCGMDLNVATLFENRAAQPAIVAAALATWEALRGQVAPPALVAGYSIGELAAWGVAGALEAGDAVGLARTRAMAMDACVREPQALAALGGLPVQTLAQLAANHGYELAIVTGADSCIAGGLLAAAAALESGVTAAGARFQKLPVGVASHTGLMAGAVAPFAAALEASRFSLQACPVLSGIAAVRVDGKQGAVDHLSRQLTQTIQWTACMDAAAEAGIGVALELGPGAALSRMLRERHAGIEARSVSEFRSIEGVAGWVQRQLG